MKNVRVRRGMSTTQIVLIVVGVVVGVLVLTCVGFIVLNMVILTPALGQAQERANALRSATQMRQIGMNIEIAARDQEGEVKSIDALIDRGYMTRELAESPFGPARDGRGDYWVQFDRPELDDVDDPAAYITAYDRAMYETRDIVSACVLAGDCSTYEFSEFQFLLDSQVNEGRDFDLPARNQHGN